jgi:hypothetical protein
MNVHGPLSVDDTHQPPETNNDGWVQQLDPKLQPLIESLTRQDRYKLSSVFPKTTGMGAKGDIKRRVKMLGSIEGRLDTLLYPDEHIEYVALAVLNRWAEQYFMGIWAMTINRTLLVFTQYRAILLYADSKGRAKKQAWQIPYHRLRKYGAGVWAGSVCFALDDKKKYKFTAMKKQDRKQLREYMKARLENPATDIPEFPSHEARDSLCPGCWSPIPPKLRVCPHCDEEFIDPKVPALMSLIVPGTGDLYLGHRTLAIMEMIGFGFVIIICIGLLADNPSEWYIPLGLLIFANGVDAAVTHHVARKGYIAKRNAFGTGTKPTNMKAK